LFAPGQGPVLLLFLRTPASLNVRSHLFLPFSFSSRNRLNRLFALPTRDSFAQGPPCLRRFVFGLRPIHAKWVFFASSPVAKPSLESTTGHLKRYRIDPPQKSLVFPSSSLFLYTSIRPSIAESFFRKFSFPFTSYSPKLFLRRQDECRSAEHNGFSQPVPKTICKPFPPFLTDFFLPLFSSRILVSALRTW